MPKFKPWITFQAVRFLSHRLTPKMEVFEYGCGSSTIFYAENCKSVEVVEHNYKWLAVVAKMLEARRLKNWLGHAIKGTKLPEGKRLDFRNPDNYWTKTRGLQFKAYAESIGVVGGGGQQFDLVSVDGVARASCMKHAIQAVKPGGFLILDNSERPRYAQGVARVPQSWKRWDFDGIGSVNAWKAATAGLLRIKKWQTTIWKRPAA